MSLKEIINCERSQLKKMVFIYAPNYQKPDKYYNIKINKILGDENKEVMI